MLGDDQLPQPFRTVNKIVEECVSLAFEEISKRLKRGCVVDKKFKIPSSMFAANVPVCHLDTGFESATAGSKKSASSSSSSKGSSLSITARSLGNDCVLGLSDGSIRIIVTDAEELYEPFVAQPLVEGPVVAVHSVRQGQEDPLYAVCSSKVVRVLSVDPCDTTPPASLVPVKGGGGPQPRKLTSIHLSKAFPDASVMEVSSVLFSPDGCTLAVGLNHDATVAVFELPAFHAHKMQISSADMADELLPQAKLLLVANLPAPEPMDVETPPLVTSPVPGKGPQAAAAAVSPTPAKQAGPVIKAEGPKALYHFFVSYHSDVPPHLGYYREPKHQRTASLIVAWEGTTHVSRFPLHEFFSNASDVVSRAKQRLESAAAASASTAATASAAAPAAAKGAKGDAKGGAKGGESAAATVAAVSLEPIFFRGRVDLVLPTNICTTAINGDHTLCAIGCIDGVVAVHDGLSLRRIFTAAPHRLEQMAINVMRTSRLMFQKQNATSSFLYVTVTVDRMAYRNFVDVYDVSEYVAPMYATSSSLVPSTSLSTSPVPRNAAAHRVARTTSISRLKYLEDVRMVAPCGTIPLYLTVAEQDVFLVDPFTATPLARVAVAAAGGNLATNGLWSALTAKESQEPKGPTGPSCFVNSTGYLVLLLEDGTLARIDPPMVASALYPELASFLCMAPSDVIGNFFRHCPQEERSAKGREWFDAKPGTSGTATLGVTGGGVASEAGGASQFGAKSATATVRSFRKTRGSVMSSKGAIPVAAPQPPKPLEWASAIRHHIEAREDERHVRGDRLKALFAKVGK